MRSDLKPPACSARPVSAPAILRIGSSAVLVLLYALSMNAVLPHASRACPICQEEGARPLTGGQGSNVTWIPRDSLTACPAGDSVLAGHPSRLRINVWYNDNDCNPKPGIPPDSIYVTSTRAPCWSTIKALRSTQTTPPTSAGTRASRCRASPDAGSSRSRCGCPTSTWGRRPSSSARPTRMRMAG